MSTMECRAKEEMPPAFADHLGRRRRRPLVCLGDVGELSSGPRSRFDQVMPQDNAYRLTPRKWWEWDYIAGCAETLGLMRDDATALGLGVGDEPLMFHFANHFGKVIATDLYSADTAWKEARFVDAERVLDASPIDYPRSRISIRNADMRSTGVPAASVDMVWSCSSIEHIPTLIDLFAVFAEIDRVLKPGGHAIITTEFCVTRNPYLLPGVNAWDDQILDLMKRCLPAFEWLGGTDLRFNALHPGNATRPRRYALPFSHLPACDPRISYIHRGGTLANSVGLSVIVPIAFVVRKKAAGGICGWADAPVAPWLRQFAEGLSAFFGGANESARDALDGIVQSRPHDLQTRHIAFRFAVDARARLGEQENPERLAERIHGFLSTVPAGPVQDADCLDICGYLLGESGEYRRALEVYELCLHSPSTDRPHVFELLVRYLTLAEKYRLADRAIPVAAGVLADLCQFGLSGAEYRRAFVEPAKQKMSRRLVQRVDGETRRIVDGWLGGAGL